MMGKSPLMKKLVGNQSKLPEHLKAKIEAAPESPAKLKKTSPAKNTEDLKKKYPNLIDSEGNVITSPNQQELIDRRKLQEEGVRKKNKRLFDEQTKEEDKSFEELDFQEDNEDTSTKEKTKEIAEVKTDNGKTSKGKPFIYGRNNFGSTDGGVAAGIDMAKGLNITTSKVSENISNKVKDNVLVGSGSTKRLPIDAMQDRLTKNIDRRSRKADVRKQTRTAKKSLRQEGSTRKEAKDKVGKLGINPNTGKSFENAKQKQDFINAKGKDTFISDLQKKASKTMKKGGVDPNISNKKVLSPESKKSVSTPSKKPKVPNIKTVPVAKRPALYDDGYDKKEEENNRMNRIMGTPSKMMKKAPTKMKTKTPNKMMKKAPSKMMKKAAAPKMMKKAPAKMMKKKKK